MKIVYTDQFTKRMKKFLKKHPELKPRVRKTVVLLEENIHHPSLRLHELKGEYKGVHSISINISYRITLTLQISEDTVTPIDIGSHDEVY